MDFCSDWIRIPVTDEIRSKSVVGMGEFLLLIYGFVSLWVLAMLRLRSSLFLKTSGCLLRVQLLQGLLTPG